MVKDLTTLKWKKNIYYISDNVIFDIESVKKSVDYDECGTYLVDFSKVSDTAVNAKDGSSIDISKTPEAFVNNVPYLLLEFLSMNGDELSRYIPLQYLIEEGDKIVDDKAHQFHPDIFANEYIHKFNNDVFNYVKSLVKNKKAFDPSNVAYVMNSLPDWLTKVFSGEYMTENYIDTQFLKGKHYDANTAKKGATSSHDVYTLNRVFLCIGEVGTENAAFAPVNFWQEDTVRKCLDAIYIQDFINAYNNEINSFDSTQMLSIDSMEKIVKYTQNVETAYNPNGIRTLLNVDYGDDLIDHHDIYDIKFEDICTSAITYQDYLKHKDDAPTTSFTFEDIVAEDKQFILDYINDNFENPENVVKYWYEAQITLKHTFDDENSDATIDTLSNVFELFESKEEGMSFMAIIIQHAGDKKAVKVIPDGLWVGDNDMWAREDEITVSWEEAYNAYMNSSYDKIDSRQCTLRAKVGPNGNSIAPQYILGNIHTHFFVDASNATVSNVDPVFPEETVGPLDGTSEDIRERHMALAEEQYQNVQWCETTASFDDFLDTASSVSGKIVEQSDVFKLEDETFIKVVSDEDGERIEPVENPMYSDGVITSTDLCGVTQIAHNVKYTLSIPPHSEKFAIYQREDVTIAQFGFDSHKVLVNAETMELIEGPNYTNGFMILNSGN